jgi:hypothetical protein
MLVHRVWESLLLGAIPVVARSTLSQSYEGLPIIVADDWESVDTAYLNEQWRSLQSKEWYTYSWEKMYIGYWRQRVYGVARDVRGSRRLKPELYTSHTVESMQTVGNNQNSSTAIPSAWKKLEIALVANVGESIELLGYRKS